MIHIKRLYVKIIYKNEQGTTKNMWIAFLFRKNTVHLIHDI